MILPLVALALLDSPDFTRAGYRGGSEPPAVEAQTFDPRDHGAVPDDDIDDTAALQAAIGAASAAGGGVVELGRGSWRLETPLRIAHDGVVLRGAGSDVTILDCPNSLADVHGWKPGWSWSGGFVQVAPPNGRGRVVGTVEATVARGLVDLPLGLAPGADAPRPGEWLELAWFNDTGADTLLLELHGNLLPRAAMGRELQESTAARVRTWVQVVSWMPGGGHEGPEELRDGGRDVGHDGEPAGEPGGEAPLALTPAGPHGTLTIEAPLRLDLRPEWRPTLTRRPSIREVGVEGLAFRFPETTYPGHLKERGYNAVQLSRAVDCWVTDVTTSNADSGLFLASCKRVTASDLHLAGRYMHHPISLTWSTDCLVEDWVIDAPHRHGTTLSWAAHGNVLRRGEGLELALDCHRAAPFENLHEQLVIRFPGRPTQPLHSGGSAPRGAHAGRGNVYRDVELRFERPGQRLVVRGQDEWPGARFEDWRAVGGELVFEPAPGIGQVVTGGERAEVAPDEGG